MRKKERERSEEDLYNECVEKKNLFADDPCDYIEILWFYPRIMTIISIAPLSKILL